MCMCINICLYHTYVCMHTISLHSCPHLMTLWTVAHEALLSMGFSRQGYWSGFSCPPPGDLPDPGIKPGSPACRLILYCLSHQGSPSHIHSLYTGLNCYWYRFQFCNAFSSRWSPTLCCGSLFFLVTDKSVTFFYLIQNNDSQLPFSLIWLQSTFPSVTFLENNTDSLGIETHCSPEGNTTNPRDSNLPSLRVTVTFLSHIITNDVDFWTSKNKIRIY